MKIKYLTTLCAVSLTILSGFTLISNAKVDTHKLIEQADSNHLIAEKLQPSLLGKWKNQRGSVLQILSATNNVLTGTFTTAVAKTKQCIGKPLPATGYVNGDAISLIINFAPCNSPYTVAMTGYLSHDNKLHTMYMVQNQNRNQWNACIINADVYHKFK